jgi:hypothetical protein
LFSAVNVLLLIRTYCVSAERSARDVSAVVAARRSWCLVQTVVCASVR